MRSRLWLVSVSLLACGSLSGGPCRLTNQCAAGLECTGPDEGPVCGIAPRRECGTTADCSSGLTCNAITDGCAQNGVGTQCRSGCGACEPGFRCSSTTNGCEPIPCDEGFACPTVERCDATLAHDATPAWQHGHGCVRVDCTRDADCTPGQACVNLFCQRGVGTCGSSIAVP